MFGCPIKKKIDRKTLIPFIFCKQAIEKKEIVLASKGKAQRDFVSLNKLGLIIEKKIFIKTKMFEVFNVVSGFSFSIKEIAQIVSYETSKIFKKNIEIKYNQKSKDKKNIFKVFSKIKLYKKKENLLSELKIEVRKLLIMLNEN